MTQHQQGPPQRVINGRYVLLQQLGQAGMGIVWRAADQVIGRHVAIKELRLPDELPAEERPVFADRVLRAARSAGRLNAPGVCDLSLQSEQVRGSRDELRATAIVPTRSRSSAATTPSSAC